MTANEVQISCQKLGALIFL